MSTLKHPVSVRAHPNEHLNEISSLEKFFPNDHSRDFSRVRDFGQGIGIEQDKVSDLTRLDGPPPAFTGGVVKLRRSLGGRLQGLHRRESDLDEQLKFLVQTRPWKIEWFW